MNTFVHGELLRPVSRSFYVSIRILPRSLREPVALAYLLARTTDTIADTNVLDPVKRIQMLDSIAGAIQGKEDGREIAARLRENFSPHQTNVAERSLIMSAEARFQDLCRLSADDQSDIRRLLDFIIRGQRLDLTRWCAGASALRTANELREYAYLVAGSVGEFWTRICFRKLTHFSNRSEPEILELGKRYGCGLQLVNILRDAGEDIRAGRCYLPADEIGDVANTTSFPSKVLQTYQRWIGEAKEQLRAGVEYSLSVENVRVRIATALPALIGIRTLRLLEDKGEDALRERVKVPRDEVRTIIASLVITLAARNRLRALYDQLKK